MKNFTAFKYGNYKKNALKPDAVPSLFKCQDEEGVRVHDDLRISSARRSQKKLVEEVLSSSTNIMSDPVDECVNDEGILLKFLVHEIVIHFSVEPSGVSRKFF